MLVEWVRRQDWEELAYPVTFTVLTPLVWAAAQYHLTEVSPEEVQKAVRAAAWTIGVLAFSITVFTVGRFVSGNRLSIGDLSMSTLVWFLCMLVLEEFRYEAIVALWSLAGAGVIAWWIFEQHAEELADRAWTRRNSLHVRRGTTKIVGACSSLLVDYLNLDEERHRELLRVTHSDLDQVIARLEVDLQTLEREGTSGVGSLKRISGGLAHDLAGRLTRFDQLADELDAVLSRFLPLENALMELRDVCRIFLSSPNATASADAPFQAAWTESVVPKIVRKAMSTWVEGAAVLSGAEP